MTASRTRAGLPGQAVDPGACLAAAWVAGEVWALRPDYVAHLIVAEGLRPGPSDEISEAILMAALMTVSMPRCRG